MSRALFLNRPNRPAIRRAVVARWCLFLGACGLAALAFMTKSEAQPAKCKGWHDPGTVNTIFNGTGGTEAAATADMEARARAVCRSACADFNFDCGRDEPYCVDVDAKLKKIQGQKDFCVELTDSSWSCTGDLEKCRCECATSPSRS